VGVAEATHPPIAPYEPVTAAAGVGNYRNDARRQPEEVFRAKEVRITEAVHFAAGIGEPITLGTHGGSDTDEVRRRPGNSVPAHEAPVVPSVAEGIDPALFG
jgi:hypothetical protein